MFNKIINTGLILVLAFASMGFSVSQHYCGDRLVSVSVNETPESCCGPKGQCCQNKVIYLQLEDDFVVEFTNHNPQLFEQDFVFISTVCIVIDDFSQNLNQQYLFADSSPPIDLSTYLASLQTYLL